MFQFTEKQLSHIQNISSVFEDEINIPNKNKWNFIFVS